MCVRARACVRVCVCVCLCVCACICTHVCTRTISTSRRTALDLALTAQEEVQGTASVPQCRAVVDLLHHALCDSLHKSKPGQAKLGRASDPANLPPPAPFGFVTGFDTLHDAVSTHGAPRLAVHSCAPQTPRRCQGGRPTPRRGVNGCNGHDAYTTDAHSAPNTPGASARHTCRHERPVSAPPTQASAPNTTPEIERAGGCGRLRSEVGLAADVGGEAGDSEARARSRPIDELPQKQKQGEGARSRPRDERPLSEVGLAADVGGASGSVYVHRCV